MYIADANNNRIRKVTTATDIVSTIAGTGAASYSGDGGQAIDATLYFPRSVALDSSGSIHKSRSLSYNYCLLFCEGDIYIADSNNHRIRKLITSTGIISTIAGTGNTGYSGDGGSATSATLYNPRSVAVDSSGRKQYFYLFI